MKIISRADAVAHGLKRYFTGKACLRGHYAERYVSDSKCSMCVSLYYQKHKAELLIKSKKRYEANKEKYLMRTKKWYDNNRERKATTSKAYKDSHPEKYHKYSKTAIAREKRNEWQRLRTQTDSGFRIKRMLSRRILLVLNGGTKVDSTSHLIGCSMGELTAHLQTTALENGYYDFDISNYSGKDYHIDHIIPCSSFDLSDPKEQRKCFNWQNLQVLSAKENIEKSDTLPPGVS